MIFEVEVYLLVLKLLRILKLKNLSIPDLKVAASIKDAAFEAGLICYPMSGTRDGKWGDHILLAPPFIMNESQIIELVDKVIYCDLRTMK